MPRFPYQFFDKFIVRTPLFSYKKFEETFNQEEISHDELTGICTHRVFQEAIYLASPYLYNEIKQWLSGKDLASKQDQKLKNTLLKYYSRMTTRCTPFGLFSDVGLGNFEDNKIEQNHSLSEKIRDTKLDMHFLVGLAYQFIKTEHIRNCLLFYPNNSIYRIGTKIRYIEYQYDKGKRDYIISSAPISDELQKILDFSKEGRTIKQLSGVLVNEDIASEDAEEFINELIENQVLVSEMEPNVSGKDFLDILISVLNRIDADTESKRLLLIKEKLSGLDQNIGNDPFLYAEIEELIKAFTTEYEQKYIFQTDLYNKNEFSLSSDWKKELKKGIGFLNKITLSRKDSHFEKFKRVFSERFEGQELPLSYVLDTEVGIGYRQNLSADGIHPYLDDLDFSKQPQNLIIEINPVSKILNKKVQDALLENQNTIQLTDEDFIDFAENWDLIPDTLSFMAEIVSENHSEKLYLKGSSGSSAGNLLGRFCSEKTEISELTKRITVKEKELNPDHILAEVIHLPEARIGNIIRRPTLREYEIPYLAQSVVPKENQIPVEDLLISLKNNKIVLRSKRLNKEIKPCLTNAHNYFTNTLPVYHFLSDFHSQDHRSGLSFSWEGLDKIYNFLPRVEYKNSILSKARWKLSEKDISFLVSKGCEKKQFLNQITNWRIKRKIPVWIQWIEFDHTVTMNLENYDMAKLLIQTIQSKKTIVIEECLFNHNEDFKREFIFPMYKLK
ncbi:lantibiotic dehydratase [Chryseobacterium lactis]|uniref:Lantibiotic dehydratase n=1 Tax=Chryseobacterium lactis TaxID=1241981 RepID=A0A3G6RR08_CHRLC|nr:lantibiotic dehydratase family protein [Chryseobacterium lactis]AZA85104.1 lantibiotic dehydratase [Chryseobacterium lactis]AZB07332.1 lantibiotic dehydratase [Chryseobacterium lactis]PNW11092.1 lantibiotic dehydratase [Chryseobacterium lactis]